ncbi:restriction endonuclease subunit S [Candidatus Pelagibacter sp.]|nr:restriction endonuclease subunit S [Candidatus Pelagibacter sp.]
MWKISTLGDICKMYQPQTLSKKKMNDNGKFFVYGANGVIGKYDKYNHSEPQLIVGCRGTCGSVNITRPFSWISSNAMVIQPDTNKVSLKYMEYIFKGGIDLSKVITGSAQPQITRQSLYSIKFSYPSLIEQKHITDKIDVAFAEIDKIINTSKKKITNIESIYDSFLTSVYEKCKITSGYQEKTFGNIIETLTDYHANGSYQILKKHVKLKNEKDFAYMVRSTDFEKNFKNDKRYISKASYEFLAKSKVFGGEIIMSKIGNAGKIYLMPKISYPCSLAMNLFLIKLDKSQSDNEFIYNFLKSKSGKIQIAHRIRGAATQTITKDNVRSIKVPLVKKELQKKIVSKIYTMRENTTKIKNNYIKKIDLLFRLKQALLLNLVHS